MLALLLQALYGAVDLWAVGTFCSQADVSAVSTGSQTMMIITGIVTGLSMGTTVLLGRRIGEKNEDGAAEVVGTSIWIFGVLGILLSIVMVLAAPIIADIMNSPEEAKTQTISIFILLIPMSYMQSISAFVAQTAGAGQNQRAKKAMWIGMATAVILGGAARPMASPTKI